MLGNLIILAILIALVVLFGWLTYRAIRAKKTLGQDRRWCPRRIGDARVSRGDAHHRQGND